MSKRAGVLFNGRFVSCAIVFIDYQRHIIKRMAAAGIRRRKIEFVMERSRTFVANALRTTETRKSPGRARKTTVEEDRKIVNISKKHPFSSAPEIRGRLKLAVTPRTVQRRLVSAGLLARVPRKVPNLTPAHKNARVLFAIEHMFLEDWIEDQFDEDKVPACRGL